MSARFPKTYCSQCGGEFGPGNEGFSHCSDHIAAAAPDLLAAAQVVLADLNERIDAARGGPVPIFRGIADLHAAIAKATGATQ